MVRSWPENTADYIYKVVLRDAMIKSEPGSGCFEQSCQGCRRISREPALISANEVAGAGLIHSGINSNSSNDDNGGPGDSDASVAAADRNNLHRVGRSKPGVEHNKQVANRWALRRRPETRSRSQC